MVALLALLACSSAPTPGGTLLLVADPGADGHGHGHAAATTQRLRLPDGAPEELVTGLSGSVFPADVDPKGTHALVIASEGGRDHHRETLALVPLAGGSPTLLAPGAEAVRNPSWSPDGEWIVFESSAASFRDLYKVRRDGTGLVRLTDAPHGSFEPAFSPDGQRIVFASSRDGNAEIYTMKADGTEAVRLTEEPRDDTSPRFSPDGTQVLWIRQVGTSRMLFRAGLDGSHPHAVRSPDRPAVVHQFVVSPDGRHVALAEQQSADDIDIVVLELASGDVVTTLGGDGTDEMPTWSPDGQWLAWTEGRRLEADLWISRWDGTHQRKVLERPGADWLPRWLP